ncbi:MAG: alpha/beta hydrolase domain-containing protein [Steroidobacteraceae bacterium]
MHMSRRDILLAGSAVVAAGALPNLATADSKSAASPQSAVRELPITATSRPFMSALPVLEGYTEREFSFAGEATLYDLADLPTWTLRRVESRPFLTRLLARRPVDPKRFNGTVVIDWLNVTMGFDLDGEWLTQGDALMEQGFAYVGVTVQRAGALNLVKWNPERYAGVHIDDDGFSYEIYSQTARLVRERAGDVLGDLPVKHVLAAGASQSAWRLTSYANAFHPRDRAFDGFLLRGRGRGGTPIRGEGIVNGPYPAPIRNDLGVPMLMVQNEGDLLALKSIYDRQPDTNTLRVWEIAGSAHGGVESTAAVQQRAQQNNVVIPGAASAAGKHPNVIRTKVVGAMAYRQIHRWISTGQPASAVPRLELTRDPGPAPSAQDFMKLDLSLIARDEFGNARGGLRLPDIDAPVGTLVAATQENLLGGEFKPFDAATLAKLYPTHEDYVRAVTKSARHAAAVGYIDESTAKRYVEEAKTSRVPQELPPYAQIV